MPISGTLPPAVGEPVALLGVQPGADTAALTVADTIVVMVEDGVVLVAMAPTKPVVPPPTWQRRSVCSGSPLALRYG